MWPLTIRLSTRNGSITAICCSTRPAALMKKMLLKNLLKLLKKYSKVFAIFFNTLLKICH